MTESQLLELCKDRPQKPDILWSSQVYGMGKWLKRYAGFPDDLPLCAETDHGPSNWSIPPKAHLETHAPLMLYHNAGRVEIFREYSSKPCAVMGSPFVHYRRLNGCEIASEAMGTVAFPTHSTHHIKTQIDWRRYCRDLRRIPERYQPITVCLYWKDVLDGLHRTFSEEGFRVVSAGHIYDDGFVERLYGIFAQHRFITSNEICSAGIYGMEMGLPFYLWGEQKFMSYNSGGEPGLPRNSFQIEEVAGFYRLSQHGLEELGEIGIPSPVLESIGGLIGKKSSNPAEFITMLRKFTTDDRFDNAILEKAKVPLLAKHDTSPFREPKTTISLEQRVFVDKLLGIHEALRPIQLRGFLWDSFNELVLGKKGKVKQIINEILDNGFHSRPASQSCNGCGSSHVIDQPIVEIANSTPTGTLYICVDCGTGSRIHWPISPDIQNHEEVILSKDPVSAMLVVHGLQLSYSPVLDIRQIINNSLDKDEILHIIVPGLGGTGLEKFHQDVRIQTLFTVTGLRESLRRSGLCAISVFQDAKGFINAFSRLGVPSTVEIIAPPDSVSLRSIRLLKKGKTGVGSKEMKLLEPLIAGIQQDLNGSEQVATIGMFVELLRQQPPVFGAYMLLAQLHNDMRKLEVAEQWLGLFTEVALPEVYPYQLLSELHRKLGLDFLLPESNAQESINDSGITRPVSESASNPIFRVLELVYADKNGEALDLIHSEIADGNRDPDLQLAQAIVLKRMSRLDEAKMVLQRLLSETPAHQKAISLLMEISAE